MKKFFSEAHTKKCMIFLLSIVLVLSCQRDESADIGVNEVQPSTEASPRQLQNRAREIVSSEEYQGAMTQLKLFTDKIHNEHFFTEDLFNVEDYTYNYDLIKKRLYMTSFASAEEFVWEYEKMFYSIQELVKRNPNFTDPFLQEKIEEELYNQYYDKPERSSIGSRHCVSLCNKERSSCIRHAGNATIAQLATCGVVGVFIPAFLQVIWGTCGVTAILYYYLSKEHCGDNYYHCRQGCNN